MTEGKIKKINSKGFGFIETPNGKDLFFHSSSVEGERFDELREGNVVNYEMAVAQRGRVPSAFKSLRTKRQSSTRGTSAMICPFCGF